MCIVKGNKEDQDGITKRRNSLVYWICIIN